MAPSLDLDRLIAEVVSDAMTAEPLDRLAAAGRARDELADLTEALLDHFVEAAREAGCSWSQIGATLGVTKQAAQQRHTTTESVARRLLGRLHPRRPGHKSLFPRFTDRARAVVVDAQSAARRLGHGRIGTEHLLLGLFQPDSVAAKALTQLGVTAEAVEASVREVVGCGEGPVSRHIPFSPRAKKVLELSLREAKALDHGYIGTEHILLALTRDRDGVAAGVLARHGVDQDRATGMVREVLGPDH